jgi:hypothetical protein
MKPPCVGHERCGAIGGRHLLGKLCGGEHELPRVINS